jgi:cellulose synthase/poly-beta-1,6-N-acetylglucosamine synthase-like glycosyltransferase
MMFEHHDTLKVAILAAYFGILLLLSFYGSHRYLMVYLYRRWASGDDPEPRETFAEEDLPVVTVQLPFFNERYVAERLIDAAAHLDYPLDKLEIQVLDDSTDDTTEIAQAAVDRWKAAGYDITLIHRTDRTGYKAGALQEGLRVARGEFVAVFDADFIPPTDYLREVVHHFTDPEVGMVQARWGHINRDYSLLTRAQAVLLDGHFVIEHTARNRSGRFFNFNGTAGIWRRETIRDAGGWEHDTLTEDLDLSYRAQLKGWRFVFLRDLEVPSELPVEVNAFKSQQHRWAKGSIQTAQKLLPVIMKSDQPFRVKLEAFYHLTANVAYLLLVLLALLMPVATYIRIHQGWFWFLAVDLPIFMGATFSICMFYWESQRELGKKWTEVIRLIPAVLGIGIGISLNNAKAVLEALFRHETPFVRTPKYGDLAKTSWTSKLYIKRAKLLPLMELLLGVWFTGSIAVVLLSSEVSFYSLPFLILFQFGFFYIAVLSILQSVQPHIARWKRLRSS